MIAWNRAGLHALGRVREGLAGLQGITPTRCGFSAAISLDRVNLLGNSFGSRVAQCFAAHYPDRVIRMALTGTGIGQKSISEEQAPSRRDPRGADRAGRLRFRARVAALLDPKAPPETAAIVQHTLRATNPRGFMHGVKLGLADFYGRTWPTASGSRSC